jgi:Protein of unknown function (DUF3800)
MMPLEGALMYLMYVDESGDCGLPSDRSPTRYFCLSGVVVHELRWRETLTQLTNFRRLIKRQYKVYLEDEIHSAEMINKPSKTSANIQSLKKHERLAIIRHFADQIARLPDLSIINVVVDKNSGKVQSKEEVFRGAWYRLFQRFENTIQWQNFPGRKNPSERGIVFPDSTDGAKLRTYLNDMRVKNRIKIVQSSGSFVFDNRPILSLIEDPILRNSSHSYFVQAADCAVFLLKQFIEPSTYMKKHGGNAYFRRLGPVLCKVASLTDPLGIVRL